MNKEIIKPKSSAGKGDKNRSVSKEFWDGYDLIDWNNKKQKGKKNER